MDNKILELVKINKLDYGTGLAHENCYWLGFQVTGSIGQIGFVLGKGNEDIYKCGAREFDNSDEVLAEL